MCTILTESIIAGSDKKRLNTNHFRNATFVDINDHIIPILKKKFNTIILHVRTNGSRYSRMDQANTRALDDLSTKNLNVILLGDFNIKLKKTTRQIS